MPISNLDIALIAILIAEIAGFLTFATDKQKAKAGLWRTPEATLLLFGLIGGLGAWMGQHLLRHKTRKEPFRTQFGLVVVIHLILLAAGAAWVIL
ncbi:DUF1294 domain-containing protein [Brevundimonas intermedia]|uniref:DUF1294 domain-containing protein n=1 Tax=Brevundimonas intermedia TaxID=74315 RepID=UPI00320B5048